MATRECPECGFNAEPAELTRHAIEQHGLSRPPELIVVVLLHVLAGALCLYAVLDPLDNVLRLVTSSSDFSRAFGALLLAVLMIVAAYGVALLLIANMLWKADRAGRILAIIVSATLGGGLLLGGADDSTSRWIELVTAGIVIVLLVSNGVREWFTGAFARHREEPPTIVTARALVATVAWFGFVFAAAYAIVLTVDSGQAGYALATATGTAFLLSSFGGLRRRDPGARARAALGLALVSGPLLVDDPSAAGTYIVAGPAVAAFALLFFTESSQRWFSDADLPSMTAVSQPSTDPVRRHEALSIDASRAVRRLIVAGATRASSVGSVTHLRLPRSAVSVESLGEGRCTVWLDASDGAIARLVEHALRSDALDL